jgi:hypothetical protein
MSASTVTSTVKFSPLDKESLEILQKIGERLPERDSSRPNTIYDYSQDPELDTLVSTLLQRHGLQVHIPFKT